jgi:hypothetical protein
MQIRTAKTTKRMVNFLQMVLFPQQPNTIRFYELASLFEMVKSNGGLACRLRSKKSAKIIHFHVFSNGNVNDISVKKVGLVKKNPSKLLWATPDELHPVS